ANGGFATPGLAHQAEGFAGGNGKAHPVHGFHPFPPEPQRAGTDREILLQVLNFKEIRHFQNHPLLLLKPSFTYPATNRRRYGRGRLPVTQGTPYDKPPSPGDNAGRSGSRREGAGDRESSPGSPLTPLPCPTGGWRRGDPGYTGAGGYGTTL